MPITPNCLERIEQLIATGMRFTEPPTDSMCAGIDALSEAEFTELLRISETMNSVSGDEQPVLSYTFGFQGGPVGDDL